MNSQNTEIRSVAMLMHWCCGPILTKLHVNLIKPANVYAIYDIIEDEIQDKINE